MGEHGRRVEVRPRLEVGFTGLDAGNEGAGAGVSLLCREVQAALWHSLFLDAELAGAQERGDLAGCELVERARG